MKKSLSLLIALAVLLPAASRAQVALGFGVKAGLNMSSLSSNVDDELKSKMGFAAGAFVNFDLGKGLSIQPELLYSQKGAKYSETIDGESYTLSMNLDYVDIPVLVKYAFQMPDSALAPCLYAGPYFGFKASAKFKYDLAGETGSEPIEDLKSTDFGMVFGGGLDFALGTGKLTLDVRYALGMQNLAVDTGDGETTKNGVFQVLLGFRFR